MKRLTAQQKKIRVTQWNSPTGAAEQAGYGPKITVERGFLVLRWNTEHAAEAMDTAGASLEEVLAKYLLPRLDAKKTLYFRSGSQIAQKIQVPDLEAQLEALKLALELYGAYPKK